MATLPFADRLAFLREPGRWRAGAQLAAAVAIAWGVSHLIGLPESFWAVMSVLIVMRPSAGSTLEAGWDRVRGTFAGALAGLTTGWLHVKLRIMQLLAGILVMIALYSINLRVMGKPNQPLLDSPTVFGLVHLAGLPAPWVTPAVLLAITLLVKFGLDGYFASEAGLAMRATGGNPRMARAMGISTDRLSLVALALSNGIVALAGGLFAQSQGGADVSMGIGTIVIGLAAVIIGETILPGRSMAIATWGCIVGAVLYRLLIALGLNSDFIGLKAQDLNLVTAVLVTLALVMPASKRFLARRRGALGASKKKEAGAC